ncbi:MAG: hypothetical protein ABI207_03360 [Crocinitomicaceae bacterium]
MISEKTSKIELIERFGSLTVKKIVHESYPTIGALQREYGKESLTSAIGVIISDVSLSFNSELSQNDILEVAAEIRSSVLRNVTLEGVYLACSELKREAIVGRLNVSKLLKAIHKHLNDITIEAQSKSYNDHLATKHQGESFSIISQEAERLAQREASKWYSQQKAQ